MRARKVYEFVNPRQRKMSVDIGHAKSRKKELVDFFLANTTWTKEFILDNFFEYDPENDRLTLFKTLNMCCSKVKEIPVSELYIPDNTLILNFSNIVNLPDVLVARGLNMNDCNSFSGKWPSKLELTEILNISNSNIKTLPPDLDVEILDVSYSEISEIPETINVSKELNIKGSNVKEYEVPDHLIYKLTNYN